MTENLVKENCKHEMIKTESMRHGKVLTENYCNKCGKELGDILEEIRQQARKETAKEIFEWLEEMKFRGRIELPEHYFLELKKLYGVDA